MSRPTFSVIADLMAASTMERANAALVRMPVECSAAALLRFLFHFVSCFSPVPISATPKQRMPQLNACLQYNLTVLCQRLHEYNMAHVAPYQLAP